MGFKGCIAKPRTPLYDYILEAEYINRLSPRRDTQAKLLFLAPFLLFPRSWAVDDMSVVNACCLALLNPFTFLFTFLYLPL
jgi:hypothetical protein